MSAGAQLRILKSNGILIEGEPEPHMKVGKGPWMVLASCDLADRIQALETQQDADRTAFRQQRDADLAAFKQQQDADRASLQHEREERQEAQAAQQKQLDSLARMAIVPFIDNAAVQALKFACGEQPKPGVPASATWQGLVRGKDPRARAFILDSFGRSSSKKHWALQLDRLVDTRNSQQHPQDLHELQERVTSACQLANDHPAARTECVTALYVLEHFDSLKQHFGLE